jgi:hypothetical protein
MSGSCLKILFILACWQDKDYCSEDVNKFKAEEFTPLDFVQLEKIKGRLVYSGVMFIPGFMTDYTINWLKHH